MHRLDYINYEIVHDNKHYIWKQNEQRVSASRHYTLGLNLPRRALPPFNFLNSRVAFSTARPCVLLTVHAKRKVNTFLPVASLWPFVGNCSVFEYTMRMQALKNWSNYLCGKAFVSLSKPFATFIYDPSTVLSYEAPVGTRTSLVTKSDGLFTSLLKVLRSVLQFSFSPPFFTHSLFTWLRSWLCLMYISIDCYSQWGKA